MALNLSGSVLRLIKNYHFWVVVVLLILGVIFHYPQEILSTDSPSLIPFFGLTRHAVERILFLLPITYAGFFLGIKAGIATLVISLVIMLPRVFLISQYESDALFETGGVIIIGGLINLWFYIHRRDISQLRGTEEMLAKIIDGSPIPSFAINNQHKVTQWNKAIESLTGLKKEQMIDTDEQWRAFYSAKRPVMADLIVDGASASEIAVHYQEKAQKSPLIAGAYEAEDFFPALGEAGRWLHFTASPLRDNNGNIIGAIETLQDVTEERRLSENLHYYLQQITRAQEEERKRISRELHDGTAQNLIALLHQLENYLNEKVELPKEDAKTLWGFYQQIRDVSQELRRFSRDLRPSVIDDLGLLSALEWITEEFKTEYGLEVSFEVIGGEQRLSREAELLLFRIVQEALRNVAKHAQASKAEVKVEFSQDRVAISITDNGKGFQPPDNLGELPQMGKLGLTGMQERVQLLGGKLKLKSELGKGTTVSVEAPIQ